MSRDAEKGTARNTTECERLLNGCGEVRVTTSIEPRDVTALQENRDRRYVGIGSTMTTTTTSSSSTSYPSDAENNDDPPPYSSIAPSNHVGWPYEFAASSIPYSVHAMPFRGTETPLAPFQPSLVSDTAFRPEGIVDQSTSMVPLTPYRIFKLNSYRGLFGHSDLESHEDGSPVKEDDVRSRRYGGMLVAAVVIVFLMALSLMVRFVMERSFWRG